jgi:hypothetical protein
MFGHYPYGYGYGDKDDRFFGALLFPFAAGALTGAVLARPRPYFYPYYPPYPYYPRPFFY